MQTGEDIVFSAPGPAPIANATTEVVGPLGSSLYVYWIVSRFPIGVVLSGPFPQPSAPDILSGNNYVRISWLPTPGASSYDLLVTRDMHMPMQPGNFAVGLNLTSTSFLDQGDFLQFYDLTGIPLGAPQQEHIYFDNQSFRKPRLRFIPWPIEVSSIIFEDGSEQTTAGGGGGPAGANTEIQFNDNGAFGASSRFIFSVDDFSVRPVPLAGGYESVLELYNFANEAGESALTVVIQNNLAMFVTASGPFNLGGKPLVGIGTANPGFTLDVNGDINVVGNVNVGGSILSTDVSIAGGFSARIGTGISRFTITDSEIRVTVQTLPVFRFDPTIISTGLAFTCGPLTVNGNINITGSYLINSYQVLRLANYNFDLFLGSASGDLLSIGGLSAGVLRITPFNTPGQSLYIGASRVGIGAELGNIPFAPEAALDVRNGNAFIGGNVGIGTRNPNSKLSIVGLPTSSAGLNAGDVWNNAGVLNIV